MTSEQQREKFEMYAVAEGLAITRAFQAYMFGNGRRVPVGGYVLAETEAAWAAWNAALDSERMTSVKFEGRTLPVVDWNELSRRGVLTRINEMLRAEGLAVMRVVETGTSPGAMVLGVSDGQ